LKNSIEIASLSLSSTGSRLLKYSITILLMVLFSVSLSAQDKKATLEAKKKKLLDEIEFTQKLLTKTKASKDATLSDLQALSKQIELRKKLIKEVEGEIDLFTVKINENVDSLKQKEAQLSKLKKEYSDAIVKIYKSQRFADKLLFVVNATSFSEALRRVNYLRKYATFRQQQLLKSSKKNRISADRLPVLTPRKNKRTIIIGSGKRESTA
jgi:peptidoglycan hydrolase CwlO-like protein